MRPTILALWLVAACAGDKTDRSADADADADADTDADADSDTDSDTDVDTGDTAPPVSFAADCVTAPDNVLRAVCTLTLAAPAVVEVTYEPTDGSRPERVVQSDGEGSDQTVTLVLMPPDTEHTWTARVVGDPGEPVLSGVFTTGVMPPEIDVITTVVGTSSVPMVGLASPCPNEPSAMIFDGAGVPLWYQGVDGSGFVEGVSFTEDRTAMVLVGSKVTEVALDGSELMLLEWTVDFGHRLHHDVFRKDGRTYAIFQETVMVGLGDYLMDGFYVFDETGTQIGEWHLIDHHTPSSGGPIPLGLDYSHANSIWVDDDGEAYVSFRHLSAVMKVSGDPDSPDFGTVRWTLTGDPTNTSMQSDFALTASSGGSSTFEMQHNVHRLPDGTLTMFDNRKSFLENSRVLHVQVDEVAMTADINEAFDLPLHCAFQGGAWHTDAGRPIATCAPIRKGFEFDPLVPDPPAWEMEVACADGSGTYVPRFVPLDW